MSQIRHHRRDIDGLREWELEELLEDLEREMRHARRNRDGNRYRELHRRHVVAMRAYNGERDFEEFVEWIEEEATEGRRDRDDDDDGDSDSFFDL